MAGHSTVVRILNGPDIEWQVTGQMEDLIKGNVQILDFHCTLPRLFVTLIQNKSRILDMGPVWYFNVQKQSHIE
jgi:hypothetical protein